MNTSTWAHVGRGVASLLSLKILPDDENDENPTFSQLKNDFFYVSSFALNQKEMFDSVKRVTGTFDKDCKITSTPAKQVFNEGHAELEWGNTMDWVKMLYSRMFFPGDDASLYEATHGLDNDKLRLPKEDLDEATKKAIETTGSG